MDSDNGDDWQKENLDLLVAYKRPGLRHGHYQFAVVTDNGTNISIGGIHEDTVGKHFARDREGVQSNVRERSISGYQRIPSVEKSLPCLLFCVDRT